MKKLLLFSFITIFIMTVIAAFFFASKKINFNNISCMLTTTESQQEITKTEKNTCDSPEIGSYYDYKNAAALSAGRGDLKCAAINWQKAVDKDSTSISALSNLAMILTQLEQHENALPYYEQAIMLGGGAVDTFTWYARSLKATDDIASAINWYYRALSVSPRYTDVTEELSSLLLVKNKPYEALSLLSGFNERMDTLFFKANIIAIESVLEDKQKKYSSFRTASLNEHFYVPVKLSRNGQYRGFMVDTGATITAFDSHFLEEENIDYEIVEENISMQIANNNIINGQKIKIKGLSFGPYRFRKVSAIICNKCSSLLGQNILKIFDLRTTKEKGVEFLYFKKRT